jgi:hypothetical protein
MANIWLDIGGTALVVPSLIPAALTTTVAGSTVDLIDSNTNMASAMLTVGAVSGTQGTLDVSIQESNSTNTGFNTVTSVNTSFTQVTTSGVAGTSGSQIVSFQRQKRYVRAYATFAGTFTSMLVGVTFFAERATTPANAGGWTNEQGAS